MVIAWKSNGLPEESMKPTATSDNSLGPGVNYINNAKIWIIFDESCLKQEKGTFSYKILLNFHIVYQIHLWLLSQ